MKDENTILSIENLKVYFPIKTGILQRTVGHVKAVDGVSLSVKKGETLGLVGESGCGKTTIGRAIVRLNHPSEGHIYYQGQDVLAAQGEELRQLRKSLQIIFQDPYSSLNPRHTVLNALTELLTVQMGMSKTDAAGRAEELLHQVGLNAAYGLRYPHEFSGGQRQRVAIAKALALKPKFLVCDEAVSALDVSIQAQIINLLQDLREKEGISFLFIAHDMSVVKYVSDRIGVMYLGNMMEEAETEELFSNTLHPYAKALLSAVPNPDPHHKRERINLKGELPSPMNPPSGCVFHTRCPYATEECSLQKPELKEVKPGHKVACLKAGNL